MSNPSPRRIHHPCKAMMGLNDLELVLYDGLLLYNKHPTQRIYLKPRIESILAKIENLQLYILSDLHQDECEGHNHNV